MNILILAAGTRNKIIQHFKETFDSVGCVIAADASPLAPALYDADKHYIVPFATEDGYIDTVLDICKKERIGGVLSLIDPELSVLAENERRFAELGATVIGSSYELCEMSFDKMQMYRWLSGHGYRFPRSWRSKHEFYQAVEKGEVQYPVFIKPIRGSASVGTHKARNREMLDLLFAHQNDMMIQEFLGGQEIGGDVYVDMISGEVVSIFTKRKIRMRAGETDKSVSFKDPALFALIEKCMLEAGYRGEVDIDIFEHDGQYYISEVNPRFGGGYPHAHACGCDHVKLILNNLNGKANEKNVGAYEDGVYMMKYSDLRILADGQE